MKRINLLPQEERAKASRERGLIWAIVILVAVVVALGLVYVKYQSDVNAKKDDLAAVQADLVEAFVAANGFSGADASLVRRNLWASLDSMASAATQPVPTGPEPRAAVVAPAALVAVAAA